MGEESAATPQPRPLYLERRLRQVALVAALAVIAYLGLAVFSDAAAMRDGLQRLGPGQWLALLGLSLLNYALRFLRWHGYLRALGARVGLGRDLLIYVAGFAFTVTPGKAGEAVRSVYLLPGGLGGAEAAIVALLVAGGAVFAWGEKGEQAYGGKGRISRLIF